MDLTSYINKFTDNSFTFNPYISINIGQSLFGKWLVSHAQAEEEKNLTFPPREISIEPTRPLSRSILFSDKDNDLTEKNKSRSNRNKQIEKSENFDIFHHLDSR